MERTSRKIWPLADRICPFSEVAGNGAFEAVFQVLTMDTDFENISIDSTSCKVHQSASGGEKSGNQSIGISKGGKNTEIHA